MNPKKESAYEDIHGYLVKRCLEGDSRAWEQLYKLYAPAMYNICRRMTGREDDARDVLQEAFVTAYTKLHTFRAESTFGAWLKRLVINKCLSFLQQKKLPTESIDERFDLHDEPDDDRSEYLKPEAQKILRALDKISDGCKTVFNMYLFEGYDHKEIADFLGITESTSKAQYSKAKSKIRKILAEAESRPGEAGGELN